MSRCRHCGSSRARGTAKEALIPGDLIRAAASCVTAIPCRRGYRAGGWVPLCNAEKRLHRAGRRGKRAAHAASSNGPNNIGGRPSRRKGADCRDLTPGAAPTTASRQVRTGGGSDAHWSSRCSRIDVGLTLRCRRTGRGLGRECTSEPTSNRKKVACAACRCSHPTSPPSSAPQSPGLPVPGHSRLPRARAGGPARESNDSAQRKLSRQQGSASEQALRGLWPGHELAPQLGEELGRGQVLLGGVSACEGPGWLNCAT
jgi:hypothetical protein